MAVASPATMLTEGPAFAPDSARFHGKAPAQADYCNIVKQVGLRWPIVLHSALIFPPSNALMNVFHISMTIGRLLLFNPNLQHSEFLYIFFVR